MNRSCVSLLFVTILLASGFARADDTLRKNALDALNRSTRFFREDVARHGGFQYRYSDDLKFSFGEIRRGHETAVTVQPPGTPAVGMVFLDAYELTGDPMHLEGARRAAVCLREGQLRSGGWGYGVEYDPELRQTHAYRVAPPAPDQKNTTVLDDNTTQFALRFMMRLDKTLGFKDSAVHECVEYAIASVLKAQYPNGAWPQRYDSFVDPAKFPVKKASYPSDWPRTYPGPVYKKFYTFNDNAIADMISTLFEAGRVYGDARYREAALRGADFILLAKLPDPQPAWAQQYNFDMHPVWARKFEPPGISGRESQDLLLALLVVYIETGDKKYLEPIPPALAYLKRSLRPDGRLARFYELKTNKPLYMTKNYELTYSDSDLPTHYNFRPGSRLNAIEAEYQRISALDPATLKETGVKKLSDAELQALVSEAVSRLDEKGRWIDKGKLSRYPAWNQSGQIIQSGTFVRYARAICDYLEAKPVPASARN